MRRATQISACLVAAFVLPQLFLLIQARPRASPAHRPSPTAPPPLRMTARRSGAAGARGPRARGGGGEHRRQPRGAAAALPRHGHGRDAGPPAPPIRPRPRPLQSPAGNPQRGGVPAGGADRSAARSFLARGSKTGAVAVEGGEGWT